MLAVAWVAAAAVTWAQGPSCSAFAGPGFVQPPATTPTLPTVVAYVDPVSGDDVSAAPGGAAYRTIQAACDALDQVINAPLQLGAVVLLPGWYGYDPTDSRYNGEAWPVQVRPGVRIEGVNALNVMIDGGKVIPGATTFQVPSPTTGQLQARVPCFVMGGSYLYGYTHTLINRVTIVNAEIGVLVTGAGEIHGTVAETLFMNCGVGAQVHSTGGALEGQHAPRFLWCTFGNCDVGFAMTGQTGPNVTAPRSVPALVNGLFKSDRDLEGVPCHAVSTTAFGLSRVNQSTAIPQPAQAPGSVFDVDGYAHAALFVGARCQATQQVHLGQPTSQWWFSDWRLTHATTQPGATPNPADGPGVTSFPSITPNGTPVSLDFADYSIGSESSEGPGTYGPAAGPFGGATGHLGYRSGGAYIVGGTVPGTRRFGASASGIMYNVLDVRWRNGTLPLMMLGMITGGGGDSPWINGQRNAVGVLDHPAPLGPLFGISGDVFLDYSSFPVVDLTPLLGGASTGGLRSFNLGAALGLNPGTNWSVNFVSQLIIMDAATGAIAGTDAQPFSVGL